jgi:hypothetical protein
MEGCEWPVEEFPTMICIVLARGDPQARWLALQEASLCANREVMPRAEDCCENCALDAVCALPGSAFSSSDVKVGSSEERSYQLKVHLNMYFLTAQLDTQSDRKKKGYLWESLSNSNQSS